MFRCWENRIATTSGRTFGSRRGRACRIIQDCFSWGIVTWSLNRGDEAHWKWCWFVRHGCCLLRETNRLILVMQGHSSVATSTFWCFPCTIPISSIFNGAHWSASTSLHQIAHYPKQLVVCWSVSQSWACWVNCLFRGFIDWDSKFAHSGCWCYHHWTRIYQNLWLFCYHFWGSWFTCLSPWWCFRCMHGYSSCLLTLLVEVPFAESLPYQPAHSSRCWLQVTAFRVLALFSPAFFGFQCCSVDIQSFFV